MTVQRTKQPKNNTHNTSVFWDVTPYRWEKFTAVLEKHNASQEDQQTISHLARR